ncbi:MAG: hypothetical protein JNM27_21865, partial [Leptospirales bacterium]|nr:hypothetical protein [Leptospirales bacterium]
CDVDTLLSMLTYRMGKHTVVRETNGQFDVPVGDFALRRIGSQCSHTGLPAIVIVLSGNLVISESGKATQKETLAAGDVVFLPVKSTVDLAPAPDSEVYLCQTSGTFLSER